MKSVRAIAPCLWFDGQAEEAAKLYTGVFPNSKITKIARYGKEGQEITKRAPGSVMTVAFELDGHPFTALNGGPQFRFSEAISLQVHCETQDEIDYYTEKLSAVPEAQQCGWLKDRFGVSWQIVPVALIEMIGDPESPRSERVMKAMMQMKKLDVAALKRAYEG